MLWKSLPLTIRIPELYNWQSPNSTRMMASNPRYLVFQPPTHTKLLFSLGQHARCSLALVAVDGRPGGTLPGRQVAPLPRSSSPFCLLLRHRHGPLPSPLELQLRPHPSQKSTHKPQPDAKFLSSEPFTNSTAPQTTENCDSILHDLFHNSCLRFARLQLPTSGIRSLKREAR